MMNYPKVNHSHQYEDTLSEIRHEVHILDHDMEWKWWNKTPHAGPRHQSKGV